MTVVNVETGELVQRDPEETAAMVLLGQIITALNTTLDEMPIGEVAGHKAKAVTVQTATKELGMSKEAQELAAEAVRRAEWALGRAIRKGQAEGEIATREDSLRPGGLVVDHPDNEKPRPVTDFATRGELYGSQRATGILDLADAFPDPRQLDAAIAAAKAEGNLSRANVARKAAEVIGRPRAIPRPEAERTLNALVMYADKAAREAKGLTPDQIRRIKPKADLWTVGLRNSVEVLQHLLSSLTEEK
jgi:hypothetical protein